VEAYGRQLFGETLPASALEATFFSQVGLAEVWELTQRRQQLPNVYHYVAVMRRAYEREHPDRVRKILSRMLAQQTRAFDSHPSLRERLRAQNIPTANIQLPPAARPVPVPHLDAQVAPEILPFVQNGPPSAAQELFGEDAVNLQNFLSNQI